MRRFRCPSRTWNRLDFRCEFRNRASAGTETRGRGIRGRRHRPRSREAGGIAGRGLPDCPAALSCSTAMLPMPKTWSMSWPRSNMNTVRSPWRSSYAGVYLPVHGGGAEPSRFRADFCGQSAGCRKLPAAGDPPHEGEGAGPDRHRFLRDRLCAACRPAPPTAPPKLP